MFFPDGDVSRLGRGLSPAVPTSSSPTLTVRTIPSLGEQTSRDTDHYRCLFLFNYPSPKAVEVPKLSLTCDVPKQSLHGRTTVTLRRSGRTQTSLD